MKILLIGHSVEDHIIYKGSEIIKPGGMFYTASGMLNFKDEEDDIYLCTSVDRNNYHMFGHIYDKMNTTYCAAGESEMPVVQLTLYDDKERDEGYSRLGGNLYVPIDSLKSFDGVLVNMITGFDISLDQLREIRKNFDKPIFMDVHTLSRGVDENLNRPQRVIDNFSAWAENIDIIQVNETEVFSLYNMDSEIEIVRRVLAAGTKFLLITREKKGASIYYLRNEEIESYSVSGLKIKVKNSVGCGDTFGAVFFHSFLKFGDVFKSLKMGNTAAGMISTYEIREDMSNLKHDVFTRHN
jgi:sugar/nucleoside kinase (ribokinase family)